jgi:hypothetical protein
MVYVKHAVHGNKHVDESELTKLRAEGWVKWPRTPEEKNAAPLSSPPPVVSPEAGAAPDIKQQFDSYRADVEKYRAPAAQSVEALRSVLEERGFQYDKRWGLKRLQEALDEHRA